MSTHYTSLLAWATARGAVWSSALEVRDTGPRGRGVFSAGAGLKKGDVILRLPLSLAVRPSGHLRELCAENKITNVMALALILVHELFADPSSRDPFFELLAASASPAVPLLWDRSTLHLLHGTALMGSTASLRSAALGGGGAKPGGGPPSNVAGPDAALAAAREAFATDVLPAMALAGEEYLPTHIRTMRNFETALAWVTSRGLQGRLNYEVGCAGMWPYLRTDGPPSGVGPFMLPLFDLINHASDPSERCTHLERPTGEDGEPAPYMEMRADRDVPVGEEVLHCYGAQGAAELLRTYGFSEPSPLSKITVTQAELLVAAAEESKVAFVVFTKP